MSTDVRPYPEVCKHCASAVGPEHWKWNYDTKALFGGNWKCRELVRAAARRYMKNLRADPVRSEKDAARSAAHYAAKPNYYRYKAYRCIDRARFGCETVSWGMAESMMDQPCTYCSFSPSNGLDRRDNSQGHTAPNVVPCCFVCNTILGDIPAAAKDLLIPGLTEARTLGYLDDWVPPQKRGKK